MRCEVKNCTNKYDGKWNGISFFKLPSDERLRTKWIAALKHSLSSVKPSARVCSLHFHNDDVSIRGKRQKLRVGAIPSPTHIGTIVGQDVKPSTSKALNEGAAVDVLYVEQAQSERNFQNCLFTFHSKDHFKKLIREKDRVNICHLCFCPSNEFYQMEVCIRQPMYAQFDGISEFRKTLQKILKTNDDLEKSASVCCRCNDKFKQIYSCMDRYSKNILPSIKDSELNTRKLNDETVKETCKFFNGSRLAKIPTFNKRAIVRLKKLKMVTIDINASNDLDNNFDNTADGSFLQDSLMDFEMEEHLQKEEIKSEILEDVHTEDYQIIATSQVSIPAVQNALTKQELTDNKPKEIYAVNSFDCDQCIISYDTKQGLVRHQRKIHNSLHIDLTKNHFKCDHCKKEFNKYSILKKHKELHAGTIFDCDQCNLKFPTRAYLQSHKRNMHSDKRFKCNQCRKEFFSRSGLNRHNKSHTESNFNCDLCGASFYSRLKFQDHKRYKHRDLNKRFDCHQCTKDFCNISTLRRHQKGSHKLHIVGLH